LTSLSAFKISIYFSYLLTSFLLLPLLSCSSVQSLPKRPSLIKINSLTAINLSEDMNQASTKEDEIFFLIYSIKDKANAPRFEGSMSRAHIFKKRQEQYDLNLEISIDEPNINGYLFFLVELDNQQSQEMVIEVLNQYLMETPLSQIENILIDEALGHDDLLDWYALDFSKRLPEEILFKGLQMFDRFEYRLSINYF